MLSVIQWLVQPTVFVKVKKVSHLSDFCQNLQRISYNIKVARFLQTYEQLKRKETHLGGKAITEDEVMEKNLEHQDKNKPKIISNTVKSK